MSEEKLDTAALENTDASENPESENSVDPRERLAQLESENKELYDRLLRKQAEFENYRKRVEKEKTDIRTRSRGAVVSEFLDILDSCERGLQQLTGGSHDLENYRQGLELIYRKLRTIFDHLGVKEIGAAGESFDPHLHEAVQRIESAEHSDSEIVEVLRRGYTLHGQLLRPAQVKVAVHTESDTRHEQR